MEIDIDRVRHPVVIGRFASVCIWRIAEVQAVPRLPERFIGLLCQAILVGAFYLLEVVATASPGSAMSVAFLFVRRHGSAPREVPWRQSCRAQQPFRQPSSLELMVRSERERLHGMNAFPRP